MSGVLDLPLEARADLFDALRRAAEGSGVGLAITDTSGSEPRYLFVSESLAQLLGYSQAELLARAPLSTLAPGEQARLYEGRDRHVSGQVTTSSRDTALLHRSGARVVVEATESMTTVSGRPAVVTLVSDGASRAATSNALHESEQRFRDLVDGAPDGVAILRGNVVVFSNARAASLLGLKSPDEAVGRALSDLLHPDERELSARRIGSSLASGGLDERAEYRSLDLSGEARTIEISSLPIQYQGGPAVLAFARDVTERKRMEAKLLEADRLTALGVLSAGVAHEINNPLAYVLLNLEYLKRELPKAATDPARLEALMVRVNDACHGADRVAAIVRDLRTFARGEETARTPVCMEGVLEAAVNIAYPELRSRARLERRYQTVPAVDGNAGRLEQVMLNLLLNAAQAFEQGTEDSGNLIRVSLSASGEHVVAEVSDNGPGIAPEVMGRIFDPFFTTKPVGVGTGLGLPICRGIVQTHGGAITAHSKPGHGATFRVVLPASKHRLDASGEADRVGPEASAANIRGPVLVVDDESVVSHTLKVLLQGEHDFSST
jgi:PAS domain S-box-containing protein